MVSLSVRRRAAFVLTVLVLTGALLDGIQPGQVAADPPKSAKADPDSGEIDWDRATKLHQRASRGEKLTPDEQAYYDRAKAARARQGAGGNPNSSNAKGGTANSKTKNGPTGTGNGAGNDIDWDRAFQLHQRATRGEKLTPEEQAYYDRARAIRARGNPSGAPGGGAPSEGANASGTSNAAGLIPLDALSGTERYKKETGGLYGEGKNEPPPAHLEAALREAARIQPLDADGKPSPTGKIGLLSIGMSNTSQEFSRFVQMANADAAKSPSVVPVDGAQGGQDATAWTRNHRENTPGQYNPWQEVGNRLRQAAVAPQQVQVVWIKLALAGPARLGDYPKHADVLHERTIGILHQLKEQFPNLRLAYLSSRIFGGYSGGGLNPEPYAFESAFAMRRLILEQAGGAPVLAYSSEGGQTAEAPLVLWGPYLWANGDTPRKSDGLRWDRADLSGDGVHPSDSGREKVARLLLDFFKSNATSRPWFVGRK